MQRIWKIPLSLRTLQTIDVPENGELLSAQAQSLPQGEFVVVWVWFCMTDPIIWDERQILLALTGEDMPEPPRDMKSWRYIGTVQTRDELVRHVFVADRRRAGSAR